MKTSRMKSSACPTCSNHLDAASDVSDSDNAPVPGSVSICIYCQSILEFDENMVLIPIKDSTLAEFDKEGLKELHDLQIMLAEHAKTISGKLH